ncbi:MAG TPA: adenosine kinase [Acidimicrobiales bacterium]|nr:adenosine kinase [Acidimicrobiales bacterium]
MPPLDSRGAATAARYHVVGIGNALVDVIAHHSEDFIEAQTLVKGSMTLIEADRALSLHAALEAPIEMSGGSAANTMCGVASFGGRAAYIGKVAADGLGEVFHHDLRAEGVAFPNPRARAEVPTGRCLIVVTPDAQRTMNTFLGVSSLLGPDDVSTDVAASGQVVYMEGYLYDRPEAKAAYRKAASVAHAAGRKVSLTLSDSFCVDRHRDDFLALVRDEVDLLFSNDDELRALYEVGSLDDAVARVRQDCELAMVTIGSDGSLVVTQDDVIAVKAEPVSHVVDTTGAGDLYAAGFLYGYSSGADLAECGRLGSVAAAEVISHVGARPLVPLRRLA